MNAIPFEILVIEDSPSDFELIKAGFNETSILNNICHISDGEEALEFFNKTDTMPDLILLDINLPKVDGIEILNKIRSSTNFNFVPVIILTSSIANEDVFASYSARANSCIRKPADVDNFLLVIKSIEEFWFSIVKLPN